MSRQPVFLLAALASTAAFLALAIWAWSDWTDFFRSPARAGVVIATLAMSIVGSFAQISAFSSGKREERGNRWIIPPLIVLTIAIGWFPAFDDRHNVRTLDGDTLRYAGLLLYVIGGSLRVATLFALGRRFSGLVAIQSEHELKTDGLYSVVRHPSYVGFMVAIVGWALAFRSEVGLLLAGGLLVLIVSRIGAEERLLGSEFGEDYKAYQRRTWRLVPFVY